MMIGDYANKLDMSHDEVNLIHCLRVLRDGEDGLMDIIINLSLGFNYSEACEAAKRGIKNCRDDVEEYIGNILNVDFVERKGAGDGRQ